MTWYSYILTKNAFDNQSQKDTFCKILSSELKTYRALISYIIFPRQMSIIVNMYVLPRYEGESLSSQHVSFPINRDGHDFHALFQYLFYTWVQNCTLIGLFFNMILNVKHG